MRWWRGAGSGPKIALNDVPLIPGARELVEQGIAPGGTRRNLDSLRDTVVWDAEITDPLKVLLADAQTSGGLLISVSEEKTGRLMAALAEHGVVGARVIGEVVTGPKGVMRVIA